MRHVLAVELYSIAGLRVAADTRGPIMERKTAKTTDFDPLPGRQRLRHVFEHGFDRQLHILRRQLSLLLDYALDQLRLGHDFSFFIKRLDPFSNFASLNEKGSIVTGTVKEVDAKGAVITLADDIEGTLKASEISRDRIEDARNALNVGDEVEAKIISIDRKSRVISLSIKAKDVEDEKEAMQGLRQQEMAAAGPTTIGDLIKQQMENKGN